MKKRLIAATAGILCISAAHSGFFKDAFDKARHAAKGVMTSPRECRAIHTTPSVKDFDNFSKCLGDIVGGQTKVKDNPYFTGHQLPNWMKWCNNPDNFKKLSASQQAEFTGPIKDEVTKLENDLGIPASEISFWDQVFTQSANAS